MVTPWFTMCYLAALEADPLQLFISKGFPNFIAQNVLILLLGIGFCSSILIFTQRVFPHAVSPLLTSHSCISPIAFPISFPILSFIQAIGRSCMCTPNFSVQKTILDGGVHASNSFRTSIFESKCYGLPLRTLSLSSRFSKEKINRLGFISQRVIGFVVF